MRNGNKNHRINRSFGGIFLQYSVLKNMSLGFVNEACRVLGDMEDKLIFLCPDDLS